MRETLTPPIVFKCLADDTRARMTLLIAREGELCVCELTHALELSQPKISRHLAQLREAGILMDDPKSLAIPTNCPICSRDRVSAERPRG